MATIIELCGAFFCELFPLVRSGILKWWLAVHSLHTCENRSTEGTVVSQGHIVGQVGFLSHAGTLDRKFHMRVKPRSPREL